MKKENAFLQKLDKIGNLTQVVCLSLFLTGVSVQGVSAETGFPISQSVQQTKTVTGQVVDETGEPVIGASVVVEGTTNGTITDFDGRFALQVPSGKKVVISFVGYVPQTIVIIDTSLYSGIYRWLAVITLWIFQQSAKITSSNIIIMH